MISKLILNDLAYESRYLMVGNENYPKRFDDQN